MRNYKRKTTRPLWSEQAMTAAINTYLRGNAGYMKASKRFNVPRSTLISRTRKVLTGRSIREAADTKFKHRTTFSSQQEDDLILRGIEEESKLFKLSSVDFRKIAFVVAEENDIKHHFNRNLKRAGTDWLHGFLRRHLDFSVFITNSKIMKVPKWCQTSMSLLIDLYKSHNCLYDLNSTSFNDNLKQQEALESLTASLGELLPNITETEVQRKINCLKMAYKYIERKIYTTLLNKSPTDEKYEPTLWYYKKLSFLESHFTYNDIHNGSINSNSDNYIDDVNDTKDLGTLSLHSSEVKIEELLEELDSADMELVMEEEAEEIVDQAEIDVGKSTAVISPLIFKKLEQPYFVELTTLPISSQLSDISTERPPILRQYLSPKAKRAMGHDFLQPESNTCEVAPISTTTETIRAATITTVTTKCETVTTSTVESFNLCESINQFVSYISTRMKRIEDKAILEELEDDILLKVVQAEKDYRKKVLSAGNYC